MSHISLVESLESTGISRAFYTGGLVRVGVQSGFVYSLYDGGVSVIDPLTGQTFARLTIDNDPIFTFAVNPVDNSEVVTVGKSNLLRHWSITGEHEVTMTRAWSSGHIHPVLSVDISHDGSLVATSSVDRTIRAFSLKGYFSVGVYKVSMQDPISIIRFFPRRRALASLGADNTVAVWDLDQPSLQSPVRELKGHMSTIHSISFSPDGSVMYTAGNDQMVMAWSIAALQDITLAFQVAVFESVQAVLPLSKTAFITGGDKGELRVWEGRKCVCSVPSGHATNGHIKYLSQLPQTGEIFATGVDLAMSVWTAPDSDLKISFSRQLLGNMGEILSVKWLPDNKRIVCAVNDEFPRIVNTENFSAEAKLVGHSDICIAVAVSSKGDLIATGSKDQTVRVWDAKSFACVAEFLGHTGPVNAVLFTKREDGEGVRVISGGEDNCVKIWRAPVKKSDKKPIIRSIMAHSKPVNALAISGNDKYLATGSQDRSCKIFNVDDGSLVATCSGHKGTIWSVDFSPIEQIVVTASRDGMVKLWNLAVPGTPCIRTFEGHEQSVMGCRFLHSGLQVLSADSLGTMRMWNVRTGECALIAMVDGTVIAGSDKGKSATAIEDFAESESTAKIWSFDLAVVNGATTVVSGTNSGTMNMWRDNTEALVESRRIERAETAEKDTSINVLLKAGRFNDAFKNAFELNRPRLMLEIVREANWRGGKVSAAKFVRDSVSGPAACKKLLDMVQEWQKSSKNCALAYQLVEALVRRGELDASSLDKSKFESFAEKHLGRLSSLSQKCYIVDAILLAADANVDIAAPEDKKPRTQ